MIFSAILHGFGWLNTFHERPWQVDLWPWWEKCTWEYLCSAGRFCVANRLEGHCWFPTKCKGRAFNKQQHFFFFAKLSSIKNISLTNITLKFFKKHIFEELEVTFYFTHIPSPSSISRWAEQFNFQRYLESQLFLFHPELPSWIQDPSSFELRSPCFQGHPFLINLH